MKTIQFGRARNLSGSSSRAHLSRSSLFRFGRPARFRFRSRFISSPRPVSNSGLVCLKLSWWWVAADGELTGGQTAAAAAAVPLLNRPQMALERSHPAHDAGDSSFGSGQMLDFGQVPVGGRMGEASSFMLCCLRARSMSPRDDRQVLFARSCYLMPARWVQVGGLELDQAFHEAWHKGGKSFPSHRHSTAEYGNSNPTHGHTRGLSASSRKQTQERLSRLGGCDLELKVCRACGRGMSQEAA